jgi:hypothetical protein
MALFFTAFVYIPFGHVLTPYLDFWRTIATKLTPKDHVWAAQEFVVDPTRISQQMFYFTVTAQVVNFLTETVLPYVKRKVKDEAKGVQAKISRSAAASQNRDVKEEKDFLDRVRSEIELEVYDVTGDFREMIIQFGYLSLFSVAWPLTPCFFLINNWVELRSDAVKIAISSRRPIPWRADSIGPWIDALGFLSWLGTLTSAGIVSLCSHSNSSGPAGSKGQVEAWVVLLSVFLAEHFYLATQMVVRYLMSKVDSPGLQRERKEKYLIKKKLLEENLQQEVHEKAATPGIEKSDQITRAALEDEARRASKRGLNGPEDMLVPPQSPLHRHPNQSQVLAATARDGRYHRSWTELHLPGKTHLFHTSNECSADTGVERHSVGRFEEPVGYESREGRQHADQHIEGTVTMFSLKIDCSLGRGIGQASLSNEG